MAKIPISLHKCKRDSATDTTGNVVGTFPSMAEAMRAFPPGAQP
jgi:hypothetical protein